MATKAKTPKPAKKAVKRRRKPKAAANKRKRRPPAKKMGRPRIEFDLAQVEGLASIMATDVEIAQVFGCSVRTIEMRKVSDPDFLRALQKGRAAGKLSLRRTQWAVARGQEAQPATATAPARPRIAPNPTMLIWLGKDWLDQRDRQDIVTHNEVEEFSAAFIEAGRNLVESVAAGASPEEVLRVFEAEVKAIGGKPERSGDGLPN